MRTRNDGGAKKQADLWIEQPLLAPIPCGRCSSTASPTLPLFLPELKPAPFLFPIPTSLSDRNGRSRVTYPDGSHPRAQGTLSLLPAGKGNFAEDGRVPSVEMAPGVSKAGELSGNPQNVFYLQQHSFPESSQFLFFLPIKTTTKNFRAVLSVF